MSIPAKQVHSSTCLRCHCCHNSSRSNTCQQEQTTFDTAPPHASGPSFSVHHQPHSVLTTHHDPSRTAPTALHPTVDIPTHHVFSAAAPHHPECGRVRRFFCSLSLPKISTVLCYESLGSISPPFARVRDEEEEERRWMRFVMRGWRAVSDSRSPRTRTAVLRGLHVSIVFSPQSSLVLWLKPGCQYGGTHKNSGALTYAKLASGVLVRSSPLKALFLS